MPSGEGAASFARRLGDVLLVLAAVAAGTATIWSRRTEPAVTGGSGSVSTRTVANWRELVLPAARPSAPAGGAFILVFVDYECPACRAFDSVLDAIEDEFAGRVAIGMIHFPLRQHKSAVLAANAAECAEGQGRFRAMSRELFRAQRELVNADLVAMASASGVGDTTTFRRCMLSADTLPAVADGLDVAAKLRLTGTPSVMVNGELFESLPDADRLRREVNRVLRDESR